MLKPQSYRGACWRAFKLPWSKRSGVEVVTTGEMRFCAKAAVGVAAAVIERTAALAAVTQSDNRMETWTNNIVMFARRVQIQIAKRVFDIARTEMRLGRGGIETSWAIAAVPAYLWLKSHHDVSGCENRQPCRTSGFPITTLPSYLVCDV